MELDEQSGLLLFPRVERDNGVAFCCNGEVGKGGVHGTDSLNWVKTAMAMECSHLKEDVQIVGIFKNATRVVIKGANLGVPQVAAIARKPKVQVEPDAVNAKGRVDESSN